MHSLDLGARLDRSDRHVRRSRLRVGDAGARARVEFALSEALRLVTLPGEEQGRVYYFRRVNVKDVPADGNRAVWLDKVQTALSDVAQRAMHGSDRRAIASDVIFFHSHAEALELLLRRIVKRESFAEWFWPLVTRCETDASRGEQIAAIVERLRELPAAWGRVGQVLFAQRGGAGPIAVAADLPLASVARWLRELGATGVNETLVPSLTLPVDVEGVVARAIQRFGREDLRTIWLASLAVLMIAPSWLNGSVVANARATVRRIDASLVDNDGDEPSRASRISSTAILFDEAPSLDEPRVQMEPQKPDAPALDDPKRARSVDRAPFDREAVGRRDAYRQSEAFEESEELKDRSAGPKTTLDSAALITSVGAAEETRIAASVRPTIEPANVNFETKPANVDYDADYRTYLGADTRASGLYFLLNPMASLGIATAAADLRFAQARVAVRVLRHLAAHAGVEPSDPILAWMNDEIERSSEAFGSLQLEASAWPAIFGPSPRSDLESLHVVRAWALAVRRWCWRAGRMSVREIVNRSGRVLSSRTDVDVSFLLENADVRIRRVGLDIDPGWLPWFGCVVRFHYVREQPGRS